MSHDAIKGDELIVVLSIVGGDEINCVLKEGEDFIRLELRVVADE